MGPARVLAVVLELKQMILKMNVKNVLLVQLPLAMVNANLVQLVLTQVAVDRLNV